MRYRALGDSGLLVSVVGLGCNNFGRRLDLDATRAVVDAALDAGITLLDTADTYGGAVRSEELLGEVLEGRRDQVVLATKFGHQAADMGYGPAAGAKGGRAYIRRAVEQSLRRLRTDYIDLYQIHTPDPATPIAETLTALSELVREGKVRYLGHSNFAGWQIAEAACVARRAGRGAVRLGAEPLVAAGAGGRGRGRSRRPALRPRRAAVLPAGQRPADGQDPARPAGPEDSRLAGRPEYVTDAKLDRVEALIAWAEEQGGHGPRRRHRRPGRAARLHLGHRRGDHPGAGQGQRRSRRLGAVAGAAQGHQRAHARQDHAGRR